MSKSLVVSLLGSLMAFFGSVSFAEASQPLPWQLGFQQAASPVMEQLTDFHDLLLIISFGIAILVLVLIAFITIRFRRAANPTPSRTSHNTVLEVIWTVVPVIILIVIAIPSFKLLYYMDRTPETELTLKIVGHQWYWTYEYPEHGIEFDSIMIPEHELEPGQLRLLETDNRVVLPVDTRIRLLFTADDVLHAWTIPAFGVKVDTVPGRLNEAWVEITRGGVYYGQCSELCGVNHAFMPITVEAVSKERFSAWLEYAKQEYAQDSPLISHKIAAVPYPGGN